LRGKLESAKGDTFSGTIIADFLYGKEDGSDLKAAMDEINQYAELHRWTSQQWSDLLRKHVHSNLIPTLRLIFIFICRYFIDSHSVVIIGKPSSTLADKLETNEKERVAEQVKKLGPEGLARAQKILEDAKAEHGKPIPSEIVTRFSLPSTESISWIQVQSVQEQGIGRPSRSCPPSSSTLLNYITADGSPLPFFVQYDHVEVRSIGSLN